MPRAWARTPSTASGGRGCSRATSGAWGRPRWFDSSVLSAVAGESLLQGGPARIDSLTGGPGGYEGPCLVVRRGHAGAVLTAQRRVRQLQQDRVADRRLEVDLLVLDAAGGVL